MERANNEPAGRIVHHESGAVSFQGPEAVAVYRAIVIGNGLRLYANTGIRPNRAYTPRAMMNAAEEITGRKFKARAYLEAAEALSQWARDKRAGMDVQA